MLLISCIDTEKHISISNQCKSIKLGFGDLMQGGLITKLIADATNGDKVDLKQICDTLNIQLKAAPELKDYCNIYRDTKGKTVIRLNPSINSKTRFTLVAIAVAEFILHHERVDEIGITYDMFSLSNLNHKKHTPFMMLATRLAIPEHIIEKLVNTSNNFVESKNKTTSSEKFDPQVYISHSIYLPEFVRAVVGESSGRLLLNTLSIQL